MVQSGPKSYQEKGEAPPSFTHSMLEASGNPSSEEEQFIKEVASSIYLGMLSASL